MLLSHSFTRNVTTARRMSCDILPDLPLSRHHSNNSDFNAFNPVVVHCQQPAGPIVAFMTDGTAGCFRTINERREAAATAPRPGANQGLETKACHVPPIAIFRSQRHGGVPSPANASLSSLLHPWRWPVTSGSHRRRRQRQGRYPARIQIRLSVEAVRDLEARAQESGKSFSDVTRLAIDAGRTAARDTWLAAITKG